MVARKERMKPLQVVIDTNVIVSALRSTRGASYKLLWLLGGDKFERAMRNVADAEPAERDQI
jgi:predicted nucleic acid-binding protein